MSTNAVGIHVQPPLLPQPPALPIVAVTFADNLGHPKLTRAAILLFAGVFDVDVALPSITSFQCLAGAPGGSGDGAGDDGEADEEEGGGLGEHGGL